MSTETAVQSWVQLPSELFVSAEKMQRDGRMFSLYDAAYIDIDAFNKKAKQYDVRMYEADAPIDRMVKYSIVLSRPPIITSLEWVPECRPTISPQGRDNPKGQPEARPHLQRMFHPDS